LRLRRRRGIGDEGGEDCLIEDGRRYDGGRDDGGRDDDDGRRFLSDSLSRRVGGRILCLGRTTLCIISAYQIPKKVGVEYFWAMGRQRRKHVDLTMATVMVVNQSDVACIRMLLFRKSGVITN
jgi:hypothetical protein